MSASAGSFEQLLLSLLGTAYNTALRLTKSAADAEDLVQEAALLAWRGFGSFEPGSNFKAWFFRILTNVYFSKYRKQKREGVTVELLDTPELYLYAQTAASGLHGRSADPAATLMEQFDAEHITEALGRLPDDYGAVAILYFVEDMAYTDIATVLGVPVGTVRSRLHRARRLLQRSLWEVQEQGFVSRLATGAAP